LSPFLTAELNHSGGKNIFVHRMLMCSLYIFGQSEPEFRPPMLEVVQALVRLVQRANMTKRTFSNNDHEESQ